MFAWWTAMIAHMSYYTSSKPLDTVLRCYRLSYRSNYDEEVVWALVQRHGGHISIRQDSIDFWIHRDFEPLLVLAFPDLERRADLDYL
jgi:hypothetical protein